MSRISVVDLDAEREFFAAARSLGYDPFHQDVGGYVDLEWKKTRPYIETYVDSLHEKSTLEIGCNVGATSCVLGALGAKVEAVDVEEKWLRLARLNVKRYGVQNVTFGAIDPGGALPYQNQTFSLVTCNSVLEYVEASHLSFMLSEINRVLRPGGILLVLGTSNRLWPREVHSGRWLVNYLPKVCDALIGQLQRGIFPRQVTRAFPGYRNLSLEIGVKQYLEVRREAGDGYLKIFILSLISWTGWLFRIPPGSVMPSFFLALRKS